MSWCVVKPELIIIWRHGDKNIREALACLQSSVPLQTGIKNFQVKLWLIWSIDDWNKGRYRDVIVDSIIPLGKKTH